jgi:RNA polymerase sigma factor (sigma-70 family)
MSPVFLRRYRAEGLLRREFDARREKVLANVRARLRARGVALDIADLEECYAQAWQGLYTALLEGESVENPTGWLTVVCFRRAIDEHRARSHEQQLRDGPLHGLTGHVDPDLAGALDDRMRLRHIFEALRERLDARERQAASLCYLQGLSRAQAAAQMGISEARMRKLMEGRGPERPGVAAKVDDLVRTIRGGGWCEQQASSMRALAYGILDPGGERYRLAELHRRECPACHAYVLSLRGMAAVLPPLILPLGRFAAGIGGALGGGAGTGGSVGSGSVGGGAVGSGASAGSGGGAGAGAGSGAGACASGAAGGSSVLAGGSLAAKLATGCLLVAGVGGGCAALIAGSATPAHVDHRHGFQAGRHSAGPLPDATVVGSALLSVAPVWHSSSARKRRSAPSSVRVAASGQAQRELSFERISTPTSTTSTATLRPTAASASAAAPTPTSPSRSSIPSGASSEFEVR